MSRYTSPVFIDPRGQSVGLQPAVQAAGNPRQVPGSPLDAD